MLQNANGQIKDPLVTWSEQLSMQNGGTKENSNDGIHKECIAEYLSSSTPTRGLLLNQNYGYMMFMETMAF